MCSFPEGNILVLDTFIRLILLEQWSLLSLFTHFYRHIAFLPFFDHYFYP